MARGSSAHRRQVAQHTLDCISRDAVSEPSPAALGVGALRANTIFYTGEPGSALEGWTDPAPRGAAAPAAPVAAPPAVLVAPVSALEAARRLPSDTRVGVLNFADAELVGGGFLQGWDAQEETLARSSTLYAALTSDQGQRYYAEQAQFINARRPNWTQHLYSHAMIYAPDVALFKSDDGQPLPPRFVDILTSPAVHAKRISHATTPEESARIISETMFERMARVLRAFEIHRCDAVVLGNFGAGVFANDLRMVLRHWQELLLTADARFRYSFNTVFFAAFSDGSMATYREIFELPEVQYI